MQTTLTIFRAAVLSLILLTTTVTYGNNTYAKKNTEKEINDLIRKGKDAYNAGDAADAIKQFMKARELAATAKDNTNMCRATYNIGVCYFTISENGEALRNYYEAYRICKENDLGWEKETNILNGIAGVYFEEKNYRKAREIAYKCYQKAVEKKDTSLAHTYATDMALISNKEGKFNEAARFLKECKAYDTKNMEYRSRTMAVEAETMFMQKKYDKVIDIAKRIFADKHASDDNKSIVLIYLINIYTTLNDLPKAFSCVRLAEKLTGVKNKPYLFESTARLYKAAGDYSRALSCMDSVVIYKDSLTDENSRQLAENSKIKIEVMKFKADMDKQMAQMEQRHHILILIMCILIMLGIMTIIIMRNQRIKGRNRQRMIELQLEKEQHEKKLAEEQAKSVELEAHYRQEIMRRSLEQKQKELSITNMFTSSRNELIENLLKNLTDIKEVQGIMAIKNMVTHLKQMLKTDNDRYNFIANFESANPDFIKTLKKTHPGLSSSDIRFLSYIRMNMSTKDIASLTNINPESCKRRKIRISKKLGIESSAELYDYIIKM